MNTEARPDSLNATRWDARTQDDADYFAPLELYALDTGEVVVRHVSANFAYPSIDDASADYPKTAWIDTPVRVHVAEPELARARENLRRD